MTKRFFTLFILLHLAVGTYAQVNFTNYESIDDIFSDLQKSNKILHLYTGMKECEQCIDVAMQTMNSIHLSNNYNTDFISVKIMKDDKLFSEFEDKILNFSLASHIFISKDKVVLHKMNFTTSNIVTYLDAAIEAKNNLSIAKAIMESKAEYETNPTIDNLKAYILEARKLKNFDCDLMDKYVSQLPDEEKFNPTTVLFVQQQGCDIYSKAYEYTCTLNWKTKDSVWYTLQNTERVAINNRFSTNSFEKIVKLKDELMLNKLGNIIVNQHNRNDNGYKEQMGMVIEYYAQTDNIEKYVSFQNMYVERWLNFSIDSLNSLDTKARDRAFKFGDKSKGVRFLPMSTNVSMKLNNAAFKVCEKTNNREYLEKALEWSKKSLEIRENCQMTVPAGLDAFYDTYSHLLYKLDRYEEALEWQAKAVSYNALSDFKDQKYAEKYEKMKSKKL